MPFLAAAIPAIVGGAAAAGGGALVNSLVGSGGQKGSGFQAQGANLQNATSIDQAQQQYALTQEQLAKQQALADALSNQGGLAKQSDVYGQQQALANQLGAMAQGGGPNPALAQLAQTTGQNIQQQAALMAGQRGAGANAGLIARQAAQQGAATQQNAVGQAATLRAQQQLAAISALQGQQQALAGQANQIAGQQIGQNQFNTQANMAEQQALLNAIQGQNNAAVGNTSSQNSSNATIANTNAGAQNSALGGIASGIGSAITAGVGSAMGTQNKAHGGEIQGYAEGGAVFADSANQAADLKEKYTGKGPRSRVGRHLIASRKPEFAQGGTIEDMRVGGHVPGKAPVGGAQDSYKNDIVDAKLSPGEIVLPRSVTQSADPVDAAARFVAAIQAKKRKGK